MFEADLDGLPDDPRRCLRSIIELALALAPTATEGRSYGLPALKYRDKPLIGFAAKPDHLTLYPFSADVIAALGDRLKGFKTSKGSVRFTVSQPLPTAVVEAMVTARMREIDGP